MPKTSSPGYVCTKCDAQLQKWSGQCPECQAWGSVKEMVQTDTSGRRSAVAAPSIGSFVELSKKQLAPMMETGCAFFDRVLCGGLQPGSVTLVGGEPGIGKSTMLAQVCLALADRKLTVMYVTGEESPQQILGRLSRLRSTVPETMQWLDTTDAAQIAAAVRTYKPALTIVDSVQTLRLMDIAGEAGSPTQVKASAAVIADAAKHVHAPVIFVGQVTKDGDLAGPRLLEHLVDSVLMIEGDRTHAYRLLHSLKHRFGSTDENAILEMTSAGLSEVLDPSAAFIGERPKQAAGTVITCLCAGARAILVEIQALVSPAGFGTPARRVSGVDPNRVSLILAVLAKRAGLGFGDQDVFVNAVGGMDAKDPSVDLAIALALASAKLDQPIGDDVVAWGEIGLTGELRPVSRTDLRSKEAKRLGLNRVVTYEKGKTETIKQALGMLKK